MFAWWNSTLSAYARPNFACQTTNRSPFDLLGTKLYMQHNLINTIWLQNTILNPKIHCKSKIQYNYSYNNYIPKLLLAYSVAIAGEFLLEWCKYFSQQQVWYIKLCTTASCGASVM